MTRECTKVNHRILISKRQFQLLEFLEEQSDWVSSQQIGQFLNVSNKTVQNDLQDLKILLPERWEIITQKGRGILLNSPRIETVISTFKHNELDLLYEAIDALVHEQFQTLRQLSERLYASTTLTNTTLEQIERFIEKYHLTLHRNPYYIDGNEGMMRLFIFDTNYARIGMLHYRQMFEDRRQRLQEMLQQHGHIVHTTYGLNVFWAYLRVTIERIEKGYPARPFPPFLRERIEKTSLYQQLQPFFDWVETEFFLPFSISERMYLYFGLIHTEFYLQDARTPLFFKQLKEPNHPFHAFDVFVRFLEKNFALSFSTDFYFLQNLFDTFYLSYVRDVGIAFDYQSPDNFYRYFTQRPFLPYAKVNQLCDVWESAGGFACQTESRAILTTTIQDFVIRHTTVRVLFVTSRSEPIAQFILSILRREFHGKATFAVYPIDDILTLQEVAKQYDCLITDVLLPVGAIDIPYTFIDIMFSKKNIIASSELIETIKQQKERAYNEWTTIKGETELREQLNTLDCKRHKRYSLYETLCTQSDEH